MQSELWRKGNGSRKEIAVNWDLEGQSIYGLRGICRDGRIRRKKHRYTISAPLIYSNHNSDVQQHDQYQEVPRDMNLFLHGRPWELLPDLVFDPAVHDKLHRRPESSGIKWSS